MISSLNCGHFNYLRISATEVYEVKKKKKKLFDVIYV